MALFGAAVGVATGVAGWFKCGTSLYSGPKGEGDVGSSDTDSDVAIEERPPKGNVVTSANDMSAAAPTASTSRSKTSGGSSERSRQSRRSAPPGSQIAAALTSSATTGSITMETITKEKDAVQQLDARLASLEQLTRVLREEKEARERELKLAEAVAAANQLKTQRSSNSTRAEAVVSGFGRRGGGGARYGEAGGGPAAPSFSHWDDPHQIAGDDDGGGDGGDGGDGRNSRGGPRALSTAEQIERVTAHAKVKAIAKDQIDTVNSVSRRDGDRHSHQQCYGEQVPRDPLGLDSNDDDDNVGANDGRADTVRENSGGHVNAERSHDHQHGGAGAGGETHRKSSKFEQMEERRKQRLARQRERWNERENVPMVEVRAEDHQRHRSRSRSRGANRP